ncbi:MAG: hypothetical protein D6766_12295 [Verrucomicrobia bacterium]|nr:MAG: hypothetical protein D6766_12295 [Verrucomicrobiota bacterium]
MDLDDAQKQQVAAWIREGLQLSEIQDRIRQEFGRSLTYMEVKLLVSELDLVPRDPVPPTPPPEAATQTATQAADSAGRAEPAPQEAAATARPGGVTVTVDELAQPGAMLSGKVTFSDGETASWFLDELGRLGLAPTRKGYRPSNADMQQFQTELESQLRRMGF